MNARTLEGNWNITKGKLKQKFAKLTDDDLRYKDGREDEMIGRIQKRLGKTREEVEKLIEGYNRDTPGGLNSSAYFAESGRTESSTTE